MKFEHVEAGVYKITDDSLKRYGFKPDSIFITKEDVEDLVKFIEEHRVEELA